MGEKVDRREWLSYTFVVCPDCKGDVRLPCPTCRGAGEALVDENLELVEGMDDVKERMMYV